MAAAPANKPSFVSLNPCLDAILVEVANPEQILALSHYSRQPGGSSVPSEIASRFAYTGGTAEEIIALAPDIVLASVFLPPATKAALERAGLRIEAFDNPRSVAASAAQVDRMGKLAGRPDASDLLKSRLLSSSPPNPPLDDANAKPVPGPSVLLWQPGQIVAGQETLIAQLLKEAGFSSHAEALGLKQADYVPLEQIIRDPPDLLLVAGQSNGQSHPALAELEETLVHAFDPRLFYCGGPSIDAARSELTKLRSRFDEASS